MSPSLLMPYSRRLRIGVYNPCNLNGIYRADQISTELASVDILGLPATGRRAQRVHPEDLRQQLLASHWEIQWGWKNAAGMNKSCGVSLFFSKAKC